MTETYAVLVGLLAAWMLWQLWFGQVACPFCGARDKQHGPDCPWSKRMKGLE